MTFSPELTNLKYHINSDIKLVNIYKRFLVSYTYNM